MIVGEVIPRNAALRSDKPAIVFDNGTRSFGQYAERHQNREEAMRREWHLKRDRRFRKLLWAGAN